MIEKKKYTGKSDSMIKGAATILIIDDKTANIHTLETLLEQDGRTFIHATSGKEGLKLALSHNVDLIFLDVQMPEMDGFEVAQILKSNNKTKNIPIIFASAEMKERQSIMKGFEEGAVDYLSKPLDPELTKAKVSVLLQLQLQRKELMEKNRSLEIAETQIKKHLSDLETLNKELESFSYSVSHDLRAPLRSIIGYSRALSEDFGEKLGDEGSRMLNIIQENSGRMNKLIDDLLEFSRLGRKQIVKTEVNMNAVVQNILSNIVSPPDNAKIDVNALSPVYGDASLLTQVWINLISNALKYSSKSPSPKVEINSQKNDKEVTYIISDNGAGFDMDYADKLFKVFQRLHAANEFEGTGVGLALVHKIVTRHGGRVWAEGRKGEGATFYFALPVA